MKSKRALYAVATVFIVAAIVTFGVFVKRNRPENIGEETLLSTTSEEEDSTGESIADRVKAAIEDIKNPVENGTTKQRAESKSNNETSQEDENPQEGTTVEEYSIEAVTNEKGYTLLDDNGNIRTTKVRVTNSTTRTATEKSNSSGKKKTETTSTTKNSNLKPGSVSDKETTTITTTKENTTSGYKSSIDFGSLKQESPDIIAWLDIPNTVISYPVVYHEGDDEYYLSRDIYGKYSKYGSLFIEGYNNTNFNDNVTIIYGHNTTSGKMLGTLQSTYSNPTTFKEHQTIKVYTPNKEIKYKVYAALITDNSHILLNNNFNNEASFNKYFDDVRNTRTMNAQFDDSAKPVYGKKVLIISTCVAEEDSKRYIVIASQV